MADIIHVSNLSKRYGDFTAVDAVSFNVQAGEIFGILGPNGAGKTTTLEMIEGLKSVSGGTIVLDGHNVEREPRTVKSLIGVQLQSSSFFDNLNLKELLLTFGSLYGRKVDAVRLLHDVELDEKAKSQVKELSGGQKQRLSIAAALVNDPKVLFLDEPTTGLDPQARRHLWDLISGINAKGKTIVLTTHYMEEAEVLCNRVAIMDNAKIVALDTPMNLLKTSDVGSTIEFHVDRPVEKEQLSQLPDVEKVSSEDHGYTLITKHPEKTLPALFSLEDKLGFHLFNLQLHQATLEDIFLKLTGRSLRE
ncbi:MAG: ABC transporter ATP-binding protein [bacterium]